MSIVLLLAFPFAVAQESVTITGNDVVRAGETLELTVTLDRPPNFKGGHIGLTIRQPGTGPLRSHLIETSPGQAVYRMPIPIPVAAPGGSWMVITAQFSTGAEVIPLDFKPLPFQVIANPGLVFPTSAEVRVNPSQVQLLRREALRVRERFQALTGNLLRFQGDRAKVLAQLRTGANEAIQSVKMTESNFNEFSTVKGQSEHAQVFFGDLRDGYEQALRAMEDTNGLQSLGGWRLLRASVSPQQPSTGQRSMPYTILAAPVRRAFEQNELAYEKVADTGSLTFDLGVASTPTGASVAYRRQGDKYRSHPDPTNSEIKSLTYAIWIVRFEKQGYQVEEREHDPFRERNHVVHVELKPEPKP